MNKHDDLVERPGLTAMHRSELEAIVVSQAGLIERFRTNIACMVDDIEDEGDRAYFGSTNDAEDLRDLCSSLADSGNELFMPWMHGDDLYATIRNFRTEVDEAATTIQSLTERVAELEGERRRILLEAVISLKAIGEPAPHDPPDAQICGVIARSCLARLATLSNGETK